jgi:4-amino-4-deoxy-L-arabinose transferase-like glycosyltransferase
VIVIARVLNRHSVARVARSATSVWYAPHSMSGRRFVVVLAIIAAAAFAGRAVYILAETRHEHGFYDRQYYTTQAEALAHGRGFTHTGLFGKRGTPDALHPPLTTITLAPVAWATDDSELAYRFTVALAGIAVVVLIGLIGRETAGPRAGLIGAGLAAVYPNLWMNDGLVMSETFATLGTAATIFCTYRLIRDPTWRNAAGAGVACALAMLSRAELVLLIPLLIVPAALTIRGLRQAQRVRLTGVAVATALLVVAPWVIFNMTRFDRPVFLSDGDTGVLTGANCKETYSGRLLGSWFGHCTFSDYRMHESTLSRHATQSHAFQYARDHLDRLPVVVSARVGRAWSVFRPFQAADDSTREGRPYWASVAGLGMFWVLAAIAIGGAVVLRRRRVSLIPVLAPIAVVTLNAAAFYGLVRFRAPAEASIVVLAAVGLDGALAARAGAQSGAAPA